MRAARPALYDLGGGRGEQYHLDTDRRGRAGTAMSIFWGSGGAGIEPSWAAGVNCQRTLSVGGWLGPDMRRPASGLDVPTGAAFALIRERRICQFLAHDGV